MAENCVGTVDEAIHRLRRNFRPASERWRPGTEVTGTGAVALAPTGQTLAVAVSPHAVQLFDVATRKKRRGCPETPRRPGVAPGFLSRRRHPRGAGASASFCAPLAHPERRTQAQAGTARAAAWTGPLGIGEITGNQQCPQPFRLYAVDTNSGEPRGTLSTKNETITRVAAFSPDEKVLATGSDDGIVRLWDVGPLSEDPKTPRKIARDTV